MKFGKFLRNHENKEWKIYYLNYKGLKMHLKLGDFKMFEQELNAEFSRIKQFYDVQCRVMEKTMKIFKMKNKNQFVSDQVEENDKFFSLIRRKKLNESLLHMKYLMEFLKLQNMAFRKILKKYVKKAAIHKVDINLDILVVKLYVNKNMQFLPWQWHEAAELSVQESQKQGKCDFTGVHKENRKVYTVGCFDLFHRGHVILLKTLREFGSVLIVGIHDDESYFQLKNKHAIENIQTRIENVKRYADKVFVIPSTDPTPSLKAMVSEEDCHQGACYVRGDDMQNFPGRLFIENIMPIYFLPRSLGVSSSLIRSLHHSDSKIAKRAQFATLDAADKPII